MPSAIELTGAWTGDDGGIYYIRGLEDGTIAWAGLHDSGFHKGLEFTNVFRGHLSRHGVSISGHWADVPRGETMNAGRLSLEIELVPPEPPSTVGKTQLWRKSAGTTGGFGGEVLTSGAFPPGPQDIDDLTGRVQRYDVPLGENNPPCRDFTVMWGTVTKVAWPTLPPVQDDYCSFVEDDDWDGDGDFDFDLDTDWSRQESDFWTSGWLDKSFEDFPPFSFPAPQHILRLYDRFQRFHCEAAMYARENDHDHCRDAPIRLLPAWFEQAGSSVLANGRPINGNIEQITDHRVSPPVKALRFHVGRDGKQVVNLAPGATARVTGVLADDAGHENETAPEIHPIYAIDIVQEFSHRLPIVETNLSGTWHADDMGTYYLRQIGSRVWWLGMSRDQGRRFANVFHGTFDGEFIRGDWIDVPMGLGGILGGGDLTLAVTATTTGLAKIAQAGSFGATTWTKLYDAEQPPPVFEQEGIPPTQTA
jgi:hypothetical protein